VPPYSGPNADTGNRLLDVLPADALDRLRPALELVQLPRAQTIHEPGESVDHTFFPTSGLISMVAMTKDGQWVEVGMVGKEGMFSVATVLGDPRPSQRAMVQLAGTALRMPSPVLQGEVDANAKVRALLLRYVQATLTTAAQAAACNRLHPLEKRFARWLLSVHDRAGTDTFPMTHDFLAMMLGVRRPGVTVAAQSLRDDGLIAYNHGTMTIVDREGLEAASCDCYQFIQDEAKRLLTP
jgi:CRP-like cAMP-binding protein